MIRGTLLVAGLVLLAGCQTLPPTEGTSYPEPRYLERDLTVPWFERSYWRRPADPSLPMAGATEGFFLTGLGDICG